MRNYKLRIMKKLLLILLCVPLIFSCKNEEHTGECVSGDCENGQGTYVGSLISGGKSMSDNNLYVGYGKYKYVGGWKDGKRNGKGVMRFRTDEGEWIDQKYVGEWKDDVKHGQGTYTWKFRKLDDSGPVKTYEGEWKGDLEHGQGTFTSQNKYERSREKYGIKYVGQWKGGMKEGQGTYTTGHGDYTGEWKNNKMHGQGTKNFSNGDKYVGEWKNDKRYGKGTHTYSNGTVEKGLWIDGEFLGEE